jgi:hypothetical protein
VSVPVATRPSDSVAAQRGAVSGAAREEGDARGAGAAREATEAERIEATASRLVQPRQQTSIADVTQEKAAAADRPPLAVTGVTVDSARPPSAPPPSPGAAGARRRAMQAPPEAMAQTFARSSAVSPEGCYVLEPERTPDGTIPPLRRLVRLGADAGRSERAQRAVAANAETRGEASSLVPPAADSAAFGWRQEGDSIRVRFARGDDGDPVLLVFPAAGDSIRTGVASSTSASGVRAWRVAVTVRRVPCPSR